MANLLKKLIPLFLLLWAIFKEAFTWLSGADFVITRSKDPGWLGDVINFLWNPTPTFNLIVFVIGASWLAFLIHPQRKKTAPPSKPDLQPASAVIDPPPVRLGFGLRDEIARGMGLRDPLPSGAKLSIVVSRRGMQCRTEFAPETRQAHEHNMIVELEITLIPSRPLQIVRVALELDKQELDLLGPPLYAETILLPKILQIEETCTARFEMPRWSSEKKDNRARLKVFAAGQDWYSDYFKLYG